jgi:ketosteroid isomerase-like protein
MNVAELQATFERSYALFLGKPGASIEAHLEFFDEHCRILDEDHPFWLDKAAYRDHLNFHFSGLWESAEARYYELQFRVAGDSGFISSVFTIRGKPRDAGFRLRHGFASWVCHFDRRAKAWRVIALLMSPTIGLITDASPS